ncbi:metallophosphoesterase family protein, partial [Pyxidicoccus sp. 3LFB2]
MRVAILADIHGNLPACEAVLEDITRAVAPDFIVAAGDLALRGAHPRETVDLLFDRCDSVLMGNTDCYLAGNYLGGAYRERDHWKTELLRWTRDQLGPDLLQKLGALPFSVRYTPRKGQDLFVCHANPRNLEESLDPTLDDVAVRRFFNHLDAAACAFGHLHFPYRRRVGRMLIADVASAGIPRDGDLRPAYGVFTFTPKGWRVQIRRVRLPGAKATQALTARRVPGGTLLIHKLVEARYRHHNALLEAARRHSG